MAIKCKYCGEKNIKGAVYCQNCGKVLNGEMEENSYMDLTAEDPLGESTSGYRPPKKKKSLAPIAVIAAMAIAGAAGYFAYSGLYANKKFTLTVANGTGSGSYKAGAQVVCEAQEQDGLAFSEWTAAGIDLADGQKEEQSITITMPRSAVALTPVYTTRYYTLNVDGAEGSGEFKSDDAVSLTAEEKEGYTFSQWTFEKGSVEFTEGTARSQTITFKMPSEDVDIKADYYINAYSLNVNGTDGSGLFNYGDSVTLTAAAQEGKEFTGWELESGAIRLVEGSQTTETISFAMPAYDVTITAVYKNAAPEIQVQDEVVAPVQAETQAPVQVETQAPVQQETLAQSETEPRTTLVPEDPSAESQVLLIIEPNE